MSMLSSSMLIFPGRNETTIFNINGFTMMLLLF